ncbi:SusC/RagA family TonB-linked outer membrane protein [Persicitalea jodogahamensis]|uniref:SusC/RagA family TonB-linked outer membrane protein n=1 Tax=Persicitalea jodogahamensis TaxID=402147 RepID=A0A8J3DAS7_9BACT|nr:SusC/RagA family TonB-linked outer membrane protein [Persicitalea jodogahamensis]GHB77367.1 SusC/RagA family TonB-linked outer membrane protein [Persicitalea jodogahamensis]
MAFLSIFFSYVSVAQNIAVSGKVTDTGGSGLPGVTIQVKGTTVGTTSDINGGFNVANVPSNGTLVFSFVGMKAQEVAVNGRTSISVSLQEDAAALEEVVVIGYGTVKKSDATGAVAAIAAKDFNKGVITSTEQLLQGRVAGVAVTQSSGEPGSGINVRIRGTSSVRGGNGPLFVVDGVPLAGNDVSGGGSAGGLGSSTARNPLNFLNPDDIASMDILKDASATAIYGARGANGVVLITTKKGKGKGSVDYSYSLGLSTITKKYDLLSPEAYVAAGGTDNGARTDWQEQLFRTGKTNQHNLSFSGGENGSNYRFSMGYFDQEGIILNSGIKRLSGSFSGGKKFINDKLTVGASVNFAKTTDTGVPVTDNAGFSGDLLGAILKTNPTNAVYNADGTPFQTTSVEPNPMAIIQYTKDFTNTLRVLGNINAEYEILEGLKFKTVIGLDQSFSGRKSAFSRLLVAEDIANNGQLYLSDIEVENRLMENYFTYNKKFGNISFDGLLGYSYQSFDYYSKNSQATNFRVSDLDLMINNISSADNADGKGSIIQGSNSNFNELQSYFGRVNLGINDRYLLTATLRADGSTRFGSGNKYGYFPSFAAKWRLIEEDFVPKNVFSDLGLRVGYGITGNQEIPHNLYTERQRYGGASIGGGGTNINNGGLSSVAFPNPNLKWESTAQLNVGLDYAFLNNRVSGSLEYYTKNTNDLLIQIQSAQPAISPFVWTNLDADIVNSGVEINVNGIVVDKNDFGFDVNANVAFNKNTVKNLLGTYDTGAISGQGLTGAFAQRIASGQPLYAFFLREFGGYDEAGNSIYPGGDFQRFLDGKSPIPTVTGGLTLNFRYKRFDLSTFFNGVFGNYIYNNTANAYFTKGSFANGRNVTTDVVGSQEGPLNAPDVSTRFLEKGDFVRLQNLNLSYRLNTGESAFRNVRLFVTGQNLLLFTKYSGQDPEVNTNKAIDGVPSLGIDYTPYPRARTVTFGASLSF